MHYKKKSRTFDIFFHLSIFEHFFFQIEKKRKWVKKSNREFTQFCYAILLIASQWNYLNWWNICRPAAGIRYYQYVIAMCSIQVRSFIRLAWIWAMRQSNSQFPTYYQSAIEHLENAFAYWVSLFIYM